MSQFLPRQTDRKPEGIDTSIKEVNELTIQQTSWNGTPIDLYTVPIDGVYQIELLTTFVSGVVLSSGVPVYPWFDMRLNGVPNNKLAGDTAVIRLYNMGERTKTEFTNRMVFRSSNLKGQHLGAVTVEFTRPDGTRCPAADLGAWSVEFRITRIGGLRM